MARIGCSKLYDTIIHLLFLARRVSQRDRGKDGRAGCCDAIWLGRSTFSFILDNTWMVGCEIHALTSSFVRTGCDVRAHIISIGSLLSERAHTTARSLTFTVRTSQLGPHRVQLCKLMLRFRMMCDVGHKNWHCKGAKKCQERSET